MDKDVLSYLAIVGRTFSRVERRKRDRALAVTHNRTVLKVARFRASRSRCLQVSSLNLFPDPFAEPLLGDARGAIWTLVASVGWLASLKGRSWRATVQLP